jgi:hypothetical protein
MEDGQRNMCHQSAADYLDREPEWHAPLVHRSVQVATGYGWFESQQLWRQRSWVVSADGSITETTAAWGECGCYWGVVLTGKGRIKFRASSASNKELFPLTKESQARFAAKTQGDDAAASGWPDHRSAFMKDRDRKEQEQLLEHN